MGQQRSPNIHDESLIAMLLLCLLGTFFFLPVVVGGGGSGCGETDHMLNHLVHLNHT